MSAFFVSRVPTKEILSQLGHEDVVAPIMAAARSDDPRLTLEAIGSIAATVGTARQHFGLKVAKETVFADFMDLLDKQDIPAMAKEIRNLAAILTKSTGAIARGDLVYFWITGKYTGQR